MTRSVVSVDGEPWVGRGDAGYFASAYLVLMAISAIACLSLLVDGGRITTARRHADTTAFQAARSAVQQLDATAGREGTVRIDPDNATAVAGATVTALLARAGLEGRMSGIEVDGTTVTVRVEITRRLTAAALFGRGRVTVSGTGTARLGAGVANEEALP